MPPKFLKRDFPFVDKFFTYLKNIDLTTFV